jgi:sugar phosphate isomerase/epimerase
MSLEATRRGFLGNTFALATALSVDAAPTARQEEIKLGVATYSFAKYSRANTIAILRKLNVRFVSVKEYHLKYDETPAQTAAGAKEFRDAQITILSGGNIPLVNQEYLRQRFEYAKAAGMPMIVCQASAKTLPQIERLVREFDIRVAIHNHGPEDKEFPTPKEILPAIRGLDPRIGVCHDIGHTFRVSQDPLECTELCNGRLFHVHIKDMAADKSELPIGDGILPLVSLFKLLRKMSFKGGVMVEQLVNDDTVSSIMERGLSYMRGLLTALRTD